MFRFGPATLGQLDTTGVAAKRAELASLRAERLALEDELDRLQSGRPLAPPKPAVSSLPQSVAQGSTDPTSVAISQVAARRAPAARAPGLNVPKVALFVGIGVVGLLAVRRMAR